LALAVLAQQLEEQRDLDLLVQILFLVQSLLMAVAAVVAVVQQPPTIMRQPEHGVLEVVVVALVELVGEPEQQELLVKVILVALVLQPSALVVAAVQVL
jgi:hypothetical protein